MAAGQKQREKPEETMAATQVQSQATQQQMIVEEENEAIGPIKIERLQVNKQNKNI